MLVFLIGSFFVGFMIWAFFKLCAALFRSVLGVPSKSKLKKQKSLFSDKEIRSFQKEYDNLFK